jgi:hypothetical protein
LLLLNVDTLVVALTKAGRKESRVLSDINISGISGQELLDLTIQKFYPTNAAQMKANGEFTLQLDHPEYGEIVLDDVRLLPKDKPHSTLTLLYHPLPVASSVAPTNFDKDGYAIL